MWSQWQGNENKGTSSNSLEFENVYAFPENQWTRLNIRLSISRQFIKKIDYELEAIDWVTGPGLANHERVGRSLSQSSHTYNKVFCKKPILRKTNDDNIIF